MGCEPNQTDPQALAPYESPPVSPLSCVPNLDGRIDSHELAPTLNIAAAYLVSPALPQLSQDGTMIDLVGHVDDDGGRVWDWSRPEESDRLARLTAVPLTGQWYAPHFPNGEFVLAVDAGETTFGIYSHDETALRLHGIASAVQEPQEKKTLLVYETPIDFFSFPLEVGAKWTTTAKVRNGTLNGISPWSQDEVYENEVDAAGELRLPDFTFTQAMRLRTKATIKPLAVGQEVALRQVSFVFECFGEVARATSTVFTSDADDPGPDFVKAHEVRKLGWF